MARNKGGARLLKVDKKQKREKVKVARPKRDSHHKFLKRVVVFCISFIVLYTIAEIYLSYRLNIELSPVLTERVYQFFGTELVVTCVITIISDIKECISNKLNSDKNPKDPPASLG